MNERSVVKQTADKLIDLAAIVEKLEGIVPDSTTFSADLSSGLNIWPNNEDESRRIVGALIRLFKAKPVINKWGPASLEAIFTYGGFNLRVNKYRGRKCALVKKTIVHEAEPEKVVPAKAAYVEEREELVCELDAVESEIAAQVQAQEPVASETPFWA